MIAYVTPTNTFGELSVTGTDMGNFKEVSRSGAQVFSRTRNEGEEYPYTLETKGLISMNSSVDPWNVNWLNTTKTNQTASTSNFTYSLNAYALNPLSLNTATDYYIEYLTSRVYEVTMNLPGTGVYLFTYNSELSITSTTSTLISPDNIAINLYQANSPTSNPSGAYAINKNLMFVAPKSGDYAFYFVSNVHNVNFNVKQISETGSLNIANGDSKSYKEKSDNIAADTMLSSSNYVVHVYGIDVKAFEPFYYTYMDSMYNAGTANAPDVYLATPGEFQYNITSINSSPANKLAGSGFTGKAFLIIIHNNYFVWSGSVAQRSLLSYQCSVGSIPVQYYGIGNITQFSVDPKIGFKSIKISIGNETGFTINATRNPGATTTAISSITRLDPESGYISQPAIQSNSPFYMYDVLPGTYEITLIHSLGTVDNEYLKLESTNVTMGPAGHVSYSYTKTITTQGDGTIASSSNPAKQWTSTGSTIMNPVMMPFSYNNNLNLGVNVSLYKSDNPALFNQVLGDYEIWVYNVSGSAYVNAANLDEAFTLINPANPTGTYLYIGSPHKFDRVSFALSTVANGTFNWQYMTSGTTGNTLSIATDTTLTTNRLGQNGMITFDPASISKNQITFGSTTTRSMYWIRLTCTGTPTAIPAVSSMKNNIVLYRYIAINALNGYLSIDLNSGYQSGTKFEWTTDTAVDPGALSGLTESVYDIYTSTDNLIGTGSGSLVYWPTTVSITDYSMGTTGTVVPVNVTLNFRISINDINGRYIAAEYGRPQLPSVNYYSQINWSTYTNYNQTYEFNSTNYYGYILHVNASQMYDWYQFMVKSNNTNYIYLTALYANPWIKNGYQTVSSALLMNNETNNAMCYSECGIGVNDFWLLLESDSISTSPDIVTINLNVAEYQVPILKIEANALREFVSPSGGIPSWVLPVSITAGVVVVAGIGFFFYKKKHPI
jgi:hypothetical protein